MKISIIQKYLKICKCYLRRERIRTLGTLENKDIKNSNIKSRNKNKNKNKGTSLSRLRQ